MNRSRPVWPWFVPLLLLLLLYVISSGPLRLVAFRRTVMATSDGGRVHMVSTVDSGTWWPRIYAPLWRASDCAWGAPLNWYWGVFPIREQ